MNTKTLKQLCERVGFSFETGARLDWDKQDEWQRNANSYRCVLRYKGRRYSFDFWQGTGITHDPNAKGCLDCLLSDAQGGEQSFEDFCGEFGYFTNSRMAEALHKQCQTVAKNLRRLLGDDYETFLGSERE
jgi:hypothetical protein